MDLKKRITVSTVAGISAFNLVSASAIPALADTRSDLENQLNNNSINNTDYIYLSDLEYVNNMSNTAWSEIKKDTNVNGGKITLNVDGEMLQFDKGIGAHATSNVVYDVSAYSNEYTRFTSYVGVDRGQWDKGNGVKFTIYTSNDGSQWNEVKTTEVLKGNGNSVFIDIDITGAKYIKLHAHDNGSNGNDHAVYGAARILKPSYDISTENTVNIKTINDYDNLIKNTYDVNAPIEGDYEKTLLERTFVKRIGFNTIQSTANLGAKYAEAINWLVNNKMALKYYITGGEIEGGSYTNSLKAFSDIYEAYKADFSDAVNGDLYLKLAISTSLSHAKDIRLWTGNAEVSKPKVRYEIYKDLYNNGKMAEGGSTDLFKSLPVELMRWVTDNKIDDEEINWLVNNALEKKLNGQNYLDAYTYIVYTSGFNYNKDKYYDEANYDTWNAKYKIDGLTGYGTRGIHKLWMVFEEGSVCGGLAKTYANLSQVFGAPAAVVGQPGHAATLTYSQNAEGKGIWSIKNDITGWVQSEKGERLPLGWGSKNWDSYYNVSYILLAQQALDDYDNLLKAQYYNYLADVYKDDKEKQIEIYNKALEVQNYNLDSLVGLVDSYKALNKSSQEFLELAKSVAEGLAFFPLPFVEVMKHIEPYITDPTDKVIFDMLRTQTLKRATVATDADTVQPGACITMAKSLLGDNVVDTATFSFDGEHANKIMINDMYADSAIRWEYSLDNWKTRKETDAKEVTLTKEELALINPEDDIQISLVGTDAIYTIDITQGAAPSNLYANDLENQFRGENGVLEYSEDGGNTWCKYVADSTRFIGNKDIKVRYAASGTRMQSEEVQYTFTEDNQPETRKYIQLKNVSLHSYSSQQDNGGAAAKNMIDGNINTGWHNTWSGESDKYYSVEFDKARHITSIEYKPSGHNGILKDADIYTSMDGVEWTKSGEVRNLPNNYDLKTLDLDKPTLAKYVKIQAVHTYGYPADAFFTGRMLNFYEDTTIKEVTENTLPVINVPMRYEIFKGDTFNPLDIAIAKDLEDGDIILTENNIVYNKVKTDTPGEYKVKYEVTDSNGGRRSKVITVVVKDVVNKKPTITFPETTTIKVGETFDPLKDVTARDYKGEVIELTKENIAWNKVDINTPGNYQVKYTVTDSYGNTKIAYRTVVVSEETNKPVEPPVVSKKPEISFPESTTIKVGEAFDPLKDVSAKDYNGEVIELSEKNIAWNKVDINTPGNYQVKYTITDSYGNTKIAYRNVKVQGESTLKGEAGITSFEIDDISKSVNLRGKVLSLINVEDGVSSDVSVIDNKVKYNLVAKNENGDEIFRNYMVRVNESGSYSGFKTNLTLEELSKIEVNSSVVISLEIETLGKKSEINLIQNDLNLDKEILDLENGFKYLFSINEGILNITKVII